jgi:hypothetical protein
MATFIPGLTVLSYSSTAAILTDVMQPQVYDDCSLTRQLRKR